jgi:hypothetical protein
MLAKNDSHNKNQTQATLIHTETLAIYVFFRSTGLQLVMTYVNEIRHPQPTFQKRLFFDTLDNWGTHLSGTHIASLKKS